MLLSGLFPTNKDKLMEVLVVVVVLLLLVVVLVVLSSFSII